MKNFRKFIVYGKPMAKGRPRFVNRGKFVSTYTPKETINYENLVKFSYLDSVSSKEMLEGEIKAHITAFYPIPKSMTKKLKKLVEMDKKHPTTKPDLDNIAKIILDSLNGVAYKDDSQITQLYVFKKYSENPRVEVTLEEVNDDENRITR